MPQSVTVISGLIDIFVLNIDKIILKTWVYEIWLSNYIVQLYYIVSNCECFVIASGW